MAAPRRFDHEEAVRRHEAGESYREIAASVGVTESAVWQAVKRATDPEWRERDRTYRREWQREHLKNNRCIDCGVTIWRGFPSSNGPRLRCLPCNGRARATTVRDDTLRCGVCGEWKPDRDFPLCRQRKARRGRHGTCRPCQAVAKRRERDRRGQPCSNCGQPRRVLPSDRRDRDSGLCRPCWLSSPEGEEALRRAVAASAAQRRKLAA